MMQLIGKASEEQFLADLSCWEKNKLNADKGIKRDKYCSKRTI